jgi:hypothetical protein
MSAPALMHRWKTRNSFLISMKKSPERNNLSQFFPHCAR